ncbi:cyanate hydratase domain protein [Ralstonia insidiosa]|uniref:Cyanate hydratase domain protein n=1 Tax=Ralstonia insidiosa TaxID=190721 RepID=A0AAC9BMC6_9RALS|nr:cyanate hydratase domain protein [Ralstonia insidiosa]
MDVAMRKSQPNRQVPPWARRFVHGIDLAHAARRFLFLFFRPKEPHMQREDVTDLIVLQKIKKQLTWAQLAEVIGQMTLTEAQANAVGVALDLPEEAIALLQVTPYKGSLPAAVPTDPLIYRFYELQP